MVGEGWWEGGGDISCIRITLERHQTMIQGHECSCKEGEATSIPFGVITRSPKTISQRDQQQASTACADLPDVAGLRVAWGHAQVRGVAPGRVRIVRFQTTHGRPLQTDRRRVQGLLLGPVMHATSSQLQL